MQTFCKHLANDDNSSTFLQAPSEHIIIVHDKDVFLPRRAFKSMVLNSENTWGQLPCSFNTPM